MPYEVSAGSALANVEALCRHLTTQGTFDTASRPTGTAVSGMLNQSMYWVAALLTTHGYSTAQTDTEVVGFLQELNVYDTCVKVELSVPSDDRTGEGNARFQEFKMRLNQLVAMFDEPGFLGGLGATGGASTSAQPLASGISRSAKEAVNVDTDHIPARFQRGMHRNKGAQPLTTYVEGDLGQ